jgi:hypothetical protein
MDLGCQPFSAAAWLQGFLDGAFFLFCCRREPYASLQQQHASGSYLNDLLPNGKFQQVTIFGLSESLVSLRNSWTSVRG